MGRFLGGVFGGQQLLSLLFEESAEMGELVGCHGGSLAFGENEQFLLASRNSSVLSMKMTAIVFSSNYLFKIKNNIYIKSCCNS